MHGVDVAVLVVSVSSSCERRSVFVRYRRSTCRIFNLLLLNTCY